MTGSTVVSNGLSATMMASEWRTSRGGGCPPSPNRQVDNENPYLSEFSNSLFRNCSRLPSAGNAAQTTTSLRCRGLSYWYRKISSFVVDTDRGIRRSF